MDPARAADHQAGGEQPEADRVGQDQAPRVRQLAGDDDAEEAGQEEAAEDPAVQTEPAEVVLDVGHDRRHRHRLERHERDREHQPDDQLAALRG